MLVMRSLLHYLGRDGLTPFLKHLRRQMKTGEILVHQTACFETAQDAECLNDLYALMRTNKWYPTVQTLEATMAETGWQVTDSQPAASLCLKSAELAERYSLNIEDITRITQTIREKYSRPVIKIQGSGFAAYLHYLIFTCRAGDCRQ